MKKYFLILFLFLIAGLNINAQKSGKLDVIELKNGSVIKGRIIEIKPESHVKIETLCSNIWMFKMNEIEEIRYEEFHKKDNFNRSVKEEGFVNFTSFGILTGPSDNDNSSAFSIETVNGYKWNNRLFTGAGLGYESLGEVYFPVFIDLRYFFNENSLTPLLMLKAGYQIPGWEDGSDYDYYYYNERKAHGGPVFEAGAGVKINMSDKNALTFTLAYRYLSLKHTQDYNELTNYEYSTSMNRLSIKFGFCFQ